MAKLIRQRDNLTKEGFIEFVEFDKYGRGKKIHLKPEVGYACIVDRSSVSYRWMTTVIVEVISDTEFKTVNSDYKIEE
jgi:hypothetical protein